MTLGNLQFILPNSKNTVVSYSHADKLANSDTVTNKISNKIHFRRWNYIIYKSTLAEVTLAATQVNRRQCYFYCCVLLICVGLARF